MLLSIIVPFYNSAEKCEQILSALKKITDDDVECVLVDDGSSDNTYERLVSFQQEAACKTTVVTQENKGPGGARNHGLLISSGEYIWFVDSDDSIDISVIDSLRQLCNKGYDFLDFDMHSRKGRSNSMGVPAGEYVDESQVKSLLLNNFGRICTKIFRKKVFISNKVRYPENCYYEDNYLLFVLPFFIGRFIKVDRVAYFHLEGCPSVTRSGMSARYFDRLATAVLGLEQALKLGNDHDKSVVVEKFNRLFFVNTIKKTFKPFDLSRFTKSLRVMKYYRESAIRLDVFDPSLAYTMFTSKFIFIRLYFRVCWALSKYLSAQTDYFKQLHLVSWGEEIKQPEASQ